MGVNTIDETLRLIGLSKLNRGIDKYETVMEYRKKVIDSFDINPNTPIQRVVDYWKSNPPIKPITDEHMDSVIKWSSEQMNDLLSEDMMDDLLL